MSDDRRHSRARPRAEPPGPRGLGPTPLFSAAQPVALTPAETERILRDLQEAASPRSPCPGRREAEAIVTDAAALLLALEREYEQNVSRMRAGVREAPGRAEAIHDAPDLAPRTERLRSQIEEVRTLSRRVRERFAGD